MRVDEKSIADIKNGLLVLVAVEKGDSESQTRRMAERLIAYRVFVDDQGRMNRSLVDVDGELLLVPQFTLAANTSKGTRPGFSSAAEPQMGERLFSLLLHELQTSIIGNRVCCGIFGADMQVALVNDGPVTFWLQT